MLFIAEVSRIHHHLRFPLPLTTDRITKPCAYNIPFDCSVHPAARGMILPPSAYSSSLDPARPHKYDDDTRSITKLKLTTHPEPM